MAEITNRFADKLETAGRRFAGKIGADAILMNSFDVDTLTKAILSFIDK